MESSKQPRRGGLRFKVGRACYVADARLSGGVKFLWTGCLTRATISPRFYPRLPYPNGPLRFAGVRVLLYSEFRKDPPVISRRPEFTPPTTKSTSFAPAASTFKTRSRPIRGRYPRGNLLQLCHPFFTGKQKLIDTAGRVDRFEKKNKVPSPRSQQQSSSSSIKARAQALHGPAPDRFPRFPIGRLRRSAARRGVSIP